MFTPTPTVLTIDDLQRKKTLAHYQSLLNKVIAPKNDALSTLAHYQNLLERSKP